MTALREIGGELLAVILPFARDRIFESDYGGSMRSIRIPFGRAMIAINPSLSLEGWVLISWFARLFRLDRFKERSRQRKIRLLCQTQRRA